MSSATKFIARRSEERGNADHGWLKTFHTFAFSLYHDLQHQAFGSLRVINEDRVEPRTGFGTHSHREFEIFSYVVSGELEHKDSMGNVEVLTRGDIQMTSAGTDLVYTLGIASPTKILYATLLRLAKAKPMGKSRCAI